MLRDCGCPCLTLHEIINCIHIFVSPCIAAMHTANTAISWSKFANFQNKMIQYSKNQFLFENYFVKLSFTVTFSSRQALATCLTSVNGIFRDITITSSTVSDMLEIVKYFEFFWFPELLNNTCQKLLKYIQIYSLKLSTKYEVIFSGTRRRNWKFNTAGC